MTLAEVPRRPEPKPNTVHNLKAVKPAKKREVYMPPLAPMQGSLLVSLRLEASMLLQALRPLELVARIEEERKGGVGSPSTEGRVSGTRGAKLPALDARDRTLESAQKDYESELRKIIDAIHDCRNIEAGVLVDIHVATPKEARSASDMGVDCNDCKRPVACTPQDKLLAGLCESCYRAWSRAQKPDIVPWLKQRQSQRDAASA